MSRKACCISKAYREYAYLFIVASGYEYRYGSKRWANIECRLAEETRPNGDIVGYRYDCKCFAFASSLGEERLTLRAVVYKNDHGEFALNTGSTLGSKEAAREEAMNYIETWSSKDDFKKIKNNN